MRHVLAGLCLWGMLAVAGAAAAEPDAPPGEGRPNVIVILCDDLGAHDLGCYGSKFHRTPNLDRLARDGVRFTEAYAAAPICSPTRAALLTGRWPARLHLTDWLPGQPTRAAHPLACPKIRQELPLEEVTIAERLRDAGYATASIGKWHLGGEGFGPREQGFETNVGGNDAGTTYSYFAPYRRKNNPDKVLPGLEEAPDGEYLTDRLSAESVEFIERNRDKPFFLYLSHYAVHTPMVAPQAVVDSFPGPANVPGRQSNPTYAAMLERVDAGVGRIREALDRLSLTERTLVVFTSDNGGLATLEGMPAAPTINAPLREGKGYLYEGGVRVPLIVAWPGKIPGSRESAVPVHSIDLFPTLTELTGAAAGQHIDGVSVAKLLVQNTPPAARELFWHYPHYANQGSRPGGAVRGDRWKFIEYYETGRRELFDLAADGSESRNVAAQHPEVVTEMAARLAAWKASVDAQEMTANPDYRPNPQQRDGTIPVPGRLVQVHGSMLRYEPLPHKQTLGYWVNQSDWASWELTVEKPGRFDVIVEQGCGNGSGGSEVALKIGEQSLNFTVVETGGFQKFEKRKVGTIEIPAAGRHELTLKALSKPGPAVMDVRSILLAPAD